MRYAVLLARFFGGVFMAVDFLRYFRRCLALYQSLERREERQKSLPEASGLQEVLYQEMLEDMRQENYRLQTEYDRKKKDMADYYTMWTHQIKTPIAALRLLLQEEETGESAWHGGRQAEREELFKIEQYAEMALNYARLDSLSSDLLFQKQEVYPIVKQAVKKYGVLFAGSGLSFSLEEFSCSAVTDEKWLCFVIEQLLSNALKYTGEGGKNFEAAIPGVVCCFLGNPFCGYP